MVCRKCPHHVRHGQASQDGQSIQFKDRCGLRMKKPEDGEEPIYQSDEELVCPNYPFGKGFDHLVCGIYRDTFKTVGIKNNVVPTGDIQYSNNLTGRPITEMELL